jgi:FMN hydrolase / 5-amino-6-(5-phospho-D-ribitylamino)uracil phosphatase
MTSRPRLPRPRRRPRWAAIRGVCFDLGGTLVRPDTVATTGQIAQALGISLGEAREVMKKGPKRQRSTPHSLAQDLAGAFNRPALIEPLTQLLIDAQRRAEDPDVFDDALQVLPVLRKHGFSLFALSNSLGCSIPTTPPLFTKLLDAVIYSADIGAVKPERAAFAAVEQVSGMAGTQLLHVGDSTTADVGGAVAAGWQAAYLHRGLVDKRKRPTGVTIPRLQCLTALPHLLAGEVVATRPFRDDLEVR